MNIILLTDFPHPSVHKPPETISQVETFPGGAYPQTSPNIITKLMSATSFFTDGKIYYSLCPPPGQMKPCMCILPTLGKYGFETILEPFVKDVNILAKVITTLILLHHCDLIIILIMAYYELLHQAFN